MRTTLLTLAMMVVGGLAFGQAASINWMSLEEAVAAQQKEPRKIMMDVYTQWCGPCKMMMANTFPYQFGLYSDIDLAVDELGEW